MPASTSLSFIARLVAVALLLLPGKSGSTQIPLGVWEGNFAPQELLVQPEKIVMELYKENDSTIKGATHLYYSRKRYEHYQVSLLFNQADSTYLISEDRVLSYKLGFGTRSSGTYKLRLYCDGGMCSLMGGWRTHRRVFFRYQDVGAWFKQKQQDTMKKENAGDTLLATAGTHPLNRFSQVQSLVEVDPAITDSIKIQVYDNGVVDSDAVSLYLDDVPVIFNRPISTQPITFYVATERIKLISRLKLVAESLGSIPPCTAVMIIYADQKRYEVSLSSSFEKNAVVEFFLRE
jgi:hypothetical protein